MIERWWRWVDRGGAGLLILLLGNVVDCGTRPYRISEMWLTTSQNPSHVGWVKRSETQHDGEMVALGFVPPPNLLPKTLAM
ncbi:MULTISPECIES: hypothetical protein [Limnospira]|uniref:hypothetical protein n=1 Tax=Limnospira TaxID=2596745 RepID=UPI0028E1285E|nr:hypothetical protein [Limnospira sp. PMC 289.06]